MKSIHLCFLVLIVGMVSCIKEPEKPDNDFTLSESARVAVLCEGNFMWNNAQLDVYMPDSNKLQSNVFEIVNNRPLGDVLQSGIIYGNTFWLVVNNSGLLLGLDPKSFKIKHKINISKSPRYAVGYKGKLYVSDLESNAITQLDTQTLEIKTFKVLENPKGQRSGWTENIAVYNDKIVAAVYDGYLWTLNPEDESIERFQCQRGCQLLEIDAENRLWVGVSDGDSSSLLKFNSNFKLENRIDFPKGNNLNRMCKTVSGDSLWILISGQLECRDLKNPSVAIHTVIPYTEGYGLSVNPQNGDIYVSDAIDYISKGRVVVMNAKADSIKNSFYSGIIPSDFVFIAP